VPRSESFAHVASRFFRAFLSREGSKLRMNEMEGLNLKSGPALMAMNG
jgi:hypothetical protein